ncbi:MAG: PD-(D/E)XK nuclease family protein, partial [Infirmifilum sp.]
RDFDVDKSISTSLELLRGVVDESKIKESLINIKNMLNHLTRLLPHIVNKMGMDRSRLRTYAELQLIDYSVHMWGVPDLVVEDPEGRKAVIIDWKTDEGSPSEREKFQVYSYAVLEAIRLGYRDVQQILDAIAPARPEESRIYVAIIRPTHPYSDHPLMPVSGSRRGNVASREELVERIRRILISAKYLTALVVDFGVMCCRDSHENYRLKDQCSVKLGENSYYALRLTPPELPRGNPRRQERYPCKVCPYSDERSKLRECSFYFGSTDKDRIDDLMWAFRYRVYGERERAMMPYKALYELSNKLGDLATLVGDLRGGSWYKVTISNGNVSVSRNRDTSETRRRLRPHKQKCGVVEVEFKELNYSTDLRLGVYGMKWIGDEALFLWRNYMPCEGVEGGDIVAVYAPRERQPVMVVAPESHVSNLTLGVSLYGRVEWVLLRDEEMFGERCPGVCAVVTPINANLRFQFRLFKRWAELYGVKEVVLTEIGADLTHIDLGTIHSLHMALKYKPEDLPDDLFSMARRSVEEAWSEALGASQ